MEHTFRAMDEELAALGQEVAEMGGLTVRQVRAAVEAFIRQDASAAAAAAAADALLDVRDTEIEQRAVRFIALRQPMADDLRRPIAAMKIAMQLERCGDLAKNIARRVGQLEDRPPDDLLEALASLATLVADRLAAVVAAYEDRSDAAAIEVWARDTEIDDLHERVFRQVLARMTRSAAAVGVCTHLLFITKNLERIGDHATNIAELVHYELTGAELGQRPKA